MPSHGDELLLITFSERADVALEAIAAARPMADAWKARVVAVTVGGDAGRRSRAAIEHGADEVWRVGGEDDAAMSAEALTDVLHRVVTAARPVAVLLGATVTGQEVAARLAQRLRVGCASACTELAVAPAPPDGRYRLVVERRAYGGRFTARLVLSDAPLLATLLPRRFEPLASDPARAGREVDVAGATAARPRLRVLESRPRPGNHVPIDRADVIVAAGRGVRHAEDLSLLRELADLLHGEVGGSRPVVDDLQWLPADVKVGLSGTTVRPRLYLACGVAGQVEHVVGMRGARVVVAINSDAAAPIHAEADFQVVGDLYEVVPALVRALQERPTVPSIGPAAS